MSTFGDNTSEGTLLHRLHPLSKLFVVVLVCVAAFLFKQWFVAGGLAAAITLLYMRREVGAKRLTAVLRPLPVFALLIILANMFLVPRSGPLWVHAERGFVQAVRVVVIIIGSNLFLAVTDPVDLADSVLSILRPLKRLGLRVGELSLMVMIVFSFIPLMADETRRLETARAVRCGFPKRGMATVKAAVPLLVPLVIGVFRRADEIDAALRVRCYRIDGPKNSRAHAKAGRLDYVICAAGGILFLAGVYAQF